MYKLEFTLKQHTPLIHFQHDQEGATLRATEVKPKLDRFIVEKLGGIETLRNAHPDWFISNLNNALNYQMRISIADSFSYPIEVPKLDNFNSIIRSNYGKIETEGFPCYFGNMGKDGTLKDKEFVFSQGIITIVLYSDCLSLVDFLKNQEGEEIRQLFFNKRNFTNRQSKGFGSFSTINNHGGIECTDSKYYFDIVINRAKIKSLRIQHNSRFPNEEITDDQLLLLDKWKKLFYNINLFHKVIKSGYNQQRGYVKSALFKYFKEIRQIQWDKKTIKEEYFSAKLKDQIDIHPDSDILEYHEVETDFRKKSAKGNLFLVRDLLGLTSKAEWKQSYSNAIITKTNSEIDRFKSPLTYKPILFSNEGVEFFRVFLFFVKIPDGFLEKSFNVKVNKVGNLVLDTPDRKTFSLKEYFNYLTSEDFEIDDLINSENRDTDLIRSMFKMLKFKEDE